MEAKGFLDVELDGALIGQIRLALRGAADLVEVSLLVVGEVKVEGERGICETGSMSRSRLLRT